jgi:outer membrane protein assembly factor BamD (BamD/ComL family)
MAQHVASTADIFVQTSAGRTAAGLAADAPYDIRVPGTIRVQGSYGTASGAAGAPHGYQQCLIVGSRYAGDPLDDGRFIFQIPVALGPLPEDSYAVDMEDDPLRTKGSGALMIDGDEIIHIGFNYTNDVGESIWETRDMVMTGDPFFNVMERDYLSLVEGRYVDETVHFRVRDAMKDLSDERDAVDLVMMTSSGYSNTITVTETMSHSGTFKGLVKFVYADKDKAIDDYHPGEMPVKFGDHVSITYMPRDSRTDIARAVGIFKGADGDLIPFTKRFSDPDIAVKTQFSIAEAYFEMAKKHRRLGQKEVTRREIATGKKILEEALRDYPESEARAQGDFLLANLSLELAEEIEDGKEKRQYFNEALLRFTKIVGRHRDSSYAPKSQFKKALTLERMGDFDAACEEYVKLSYRWPNNELIAETIARLGQYFFRKGKALIEIESDDPLEVEKAKITAHNMFTTAAEVFGRMAVRFPQHKLAQKTTVLSGQCYMRAENFNKAVQTLNVVVDNGDADKEVRAEAMYWCADSLTKIKQSSRPGQAPPLTQAYRMFKRLTWDYPSSKWAKYARGRLTEPQVASAGEDA